MLVYIIRLLRSLRIYGHLVSIMKVSRKMYIWSAGAKIKHNFFKKMWNSVEINKTFIFLKNKILLSEIAMKINAAPIMHNDGEKN